MGNGLYVHRANAQVLAEYPSRHFQRMGPRLGPRFRLRKRGRVGGVESDVSVHLGQNLMNVAIENRDRIEAPQMSDELQVVVGGPAPLRICRIERNVREDRDGSAGFLL